MAKSVAVALLFVAVTAFKQSAESGFTKESALTAAKEVARVWKTQTARALQSQPPVLLNYLNASALPDLDYLRLAQEVQEFAKATKKRLLVEHKTGKRNPNLDTRRVLTELMDKHHIRQQVTGEKSMFAESAMMLIVVEAVLVAASVGVMKFMSGPTSGIIVCALYYLVTVAVYWDAGWNVVDAMHFAMEIPTTIGWGDMGLSSGDLKSVRGLEIWTTLHICVSAFWVQLGMQQLVNAFALDLVDDEAHKKLSEMMGLNQDQTHFAASFLEWAAAVGVGTLFYGIMESCTCSFGPSAIEGCEEDKCADTGGYTMSIVDAFYMMVISVFTLGFGDFAPKSYMGRIVGVPFFFLSVFISNHMATKSSVVIDSVFEH